MQSPDSGAVGRRAVALEDRGCPVPTVMAGHLSRQGREELAGSSPAMAALEGYYEKPLVRSS